MDDSETCVKFTIERWYPVANMSRYLPIRVYDYYAPGWFYFINKFYNIKGFEKSYYYYYFYFVERFNETIFDALPTYLLNICEVCGSSQCPYCPIFNNAVQLSISVTLISVIALILTYVYNNQNLMT